MSSHIQHLDTLTLDQVVRGLDNGTLTVTELVKSHIARIEALNPALRAVLQINPNALSIAASLDDELRKSGRRSTVHGVPVLVKDNIVTHEPLEATAGSLALLGCKPARENPAITKLRDAGAVILGTTNLSEWANFRSRPSDSGWSARGGQTLAAYHEKQDPSGSSSGSGVAVDVGFCVLALGTETSGSIISPAGNNGIVGVRPTTGLVSRDSVVPISQEQDTVGPMARSVADAAVMLSIIAGKDDSDTKTSLIPFTEIPDYKAICEQTDLSSLRLGIPRNSVAKVESPAILGSFEGLVEKLRPLVAELVEIDFPGQEKFDALSPEEKTDAIAGDFKIAIADYLSKLETNPMSLKDMEGICEFTKNTEGEEYPERGIERLEQTVQRESSSAEFKAAQKVREYLAGEGGIQGALQTYSLDALLVPSKAPANYFAACGGFPEITVPLGYKPEDTEVKHNDTGNLVDDGPHIPLVLSRKQLLGESLIFGDRYGVSVIGDSFSEATLFRVSSVIEKLTLTRSEAKMMRLEQFR